MNYRGYRYVVELDEEGYYWPTVCADSTGRGSGSIPNAHKCERCWGVDSYFSTRVEIKESAPVSDSKQRAAFKAAKRKIEGQIDLHLKKKHR